MRSTRYPLSPRARVGLLLFVLALLLAPASSASAAAGDVDPTFGGDGIVTTEFGNSMDASDVAIQGDGKLSWSERSVSIYRTPDSGGSVQPRRHARRDVRGRRRAGRHVTDFTRGLDYADEVLIQADGNLVAIGYARSPVDTRFALVRYQGD